MIEKWCEFSDCLKHPDYVEKEVETTGLDYYISGSKLSDGWTSAQVNTSITIQTDDIKIPIECLVCNHMKKIDMKEAILINKAKRLLGN